MLDNGSFVAEPDSARDPDHQETWDDRGLLSRNCLRYESCIWEVSRGVAKNYAPVMRAVRAALATRWVQIDEDGATVAVKSQVFGGDWLDIYKDRLVYRPKKTLLGTFKPGKLVYVQVFNADPRHGRVCDIPLGFYKVSSITGASEVHLDLVHESLLDVTKEAERVIDILQRSTNKRSAIEILQSSTKKRSLDVEPAVSSRGSFGSAAAAEPPAERPPTMDGCSSSLSSQASPHLSPEDLRERTSSEKGQEVCQQGGGSEVSRVTAVGRRSFRIEYQGVCFDSQLELIHYLAFRRLRLDYTVSRSSYDLQYQIRSRDQRSYTPDGTLWALFQGKETLFHVEIKPSFKFTTGELELCYCLSVATQQHVLCVSGGYLDRDPSEEDQRPAGGNSYADIERPAAFMSLCIYAPAGKGKATWFPAVFWQESADAGAPPILTSTPVSHPQSFVEQQRKLERVYYQARTEAKKICREQSQVASSQSFAFGR